MVDEDGAGQVEHRVRRFSLRNGDRHQHGDLLHALETQQLLFRISHPYFIVAQKAVGVRHQQSQGGIVQALQNQHRRFRADLQQRKLVRAFKTCQPAREVDHLVRINTASAEAGVDFYLLLSCHNAAATNRSSLLVSMARRFSSITRL